MASEGFREVGSVLRCRSGGFEEEQEEEERLEREGGEVRVRLLYSRWRTSSPSPPSKKRIRLPLGVKLG